MGRPRNLTPKYGRHRDQGRVTWTDSDGHRHYHTLPGKFGSDESRKAYGRFLVEFKVSQPLPPPTSGGRYVADVAAAYLSHAERHYLDSHGQFTSGYREAKRVATRLTDLYGDTLADDFGPLALKAVRQSWIDDKISRGECNRRVRVLRHLFRWASSEELVSPSVCQSLATVVGLQKGRTPAREPRPIKPVPAKIIDATLPHVNRFVRGLIQFQRFTGCRPGEACRLRLADIDRSGPVWFYRRANDHKKAHLGKSLAVAIGPRAQAVITPFFTSDPNAYLFSPRIAVTELHASRTKARETPRYGSHMTRNREKRVKNPKRAPAERYSTGTYSNAIRRACESAGVPHWHPNQLRHTFATEVRQRFGLEAAQAVLQHERADVTQIYAERNESLAAEVVAKMG